MQARQYAKIKKYSYIYNSSKVYVSRLLYSCFAVVYTQVIFIWTERTTVNIVSYVFFWLFGWAAFKLLQSYSSRQGRDSGRRGSRKRWKRRRWVDWIKINLQKGFLAILCVSFERNKRDYGVWSISHINRFGSLFNLIYTKGVTTTSLFYCILLSFWWCELPTFLYRVLYLHWVEWNSRLNTFSMEIYINSIGIPWMNINSRVEYTLVILCWCNSIPRIGLEHLRKENENKENFLITYMFSLFFTRRRRHTCCTPILNVCKHRETPDR